MSSLAEAAPRGWPLLSFLREELAPWEGRFAASLRIALCCTLVVALCMLFQVPEAGYAAYLVYLASQKEVTGTVLTGVVSAVAATFALFLSIALYALDASQPALRLPLMAGATFVGMYLSRVLALGPAAFLAGFVVVITQTLVDAIPSLELLVRIILWLWVVVMLPVAITTVAELAFGRKTGELVRATALRLLDELVHGLRRGGTAAGALAEVPELVELRKRAAILDHRLRGSTQADQALIELLGELLALLPVLPAATPAEVREALARAGAACRTAFEHGAAPDLRGLLPAPEQLAALPPDQLPVVAAVAGALQRLADGLARRLAPPAASPKPAAARPVASALARRDHALFALKTTIAAMAAYILYTAVAWPGIRTCVVTCFFVALTTFGETVHKLTLRLSGAVIGGLLGGLCVVFLLPWLTDIGQLCLLVCAVSLGCAWVSTSSPRLSYCGAQMAFAFFLTVLQGYAPTDDLTAPRDRVAGILLGNVLMSLVFSLAWPVSAVAQLRAALGGVARGLAQLLRELPPPPGRRMAVLESIAKARQLLSISIFEQGTLSQAADAAAVNRALAEMEAAAAAAFVVAGLDAPRPDEPLHAVDAAAANWLDGYAGAPDAGGARPPLPAAPPAAAGLPPAGRAPLQARQLLLAGLDRVRLHAP